MTIEQSLESTEVHTHRKDHYQDRKRAGEPTPRQCNIGPGPPDDRTSSARNDYEKDSKRTGHHGQRKYPADEKFVGRQGEEKEVQRLAKYRVQEATGGMRRVPEERDRRPLQHHRGPGSNRNSQRKAEGDEAQDRLHRQLQRLSADQNRVSSRQIAQMRSLQSQKRSVQNKKCGCRKSREDSPLEA